MRPYRRQLLALVLLLGVVALVAQVAGVGGTRSSTPPAPQARTLAVVPGASVPDVTSTTFETATVRASADEVVRMRATASLRLAKAPTDEAVQVVCGIRYSRAGDASWTLGTPYETIVLRGVGTTERVTIERSFTAPARDRYRMSSSCHVAAPELGARVVGTGSIRASLGLPEGAATPVE
jgi:hypothetical protein